MDSVEIGILARVRDAGRQQGVNVAVACADVNVLKILELLNMK